MAGWNRRNPSARGLGIAYGRVVEHPDGSRTIEELDPNMATHQVTEVETPPELDLERLSVELAKTTGEATLARSDREHVDLYLVDRLARAFLAAGWSPPES